MWFSLFLLITNAFFLLLFARLFAERDDRDWIFNPYLLWAGRVADGAGRFATDILPGLPMRGGAGVALIFLLAFRGALMVAATNMKWALSVGSTFFFHPRTGWIGAIAFSILHFAAFLIHFWGLALLVHLLAEPTTSRTRIRQAFDAFAAPLSRGPIWARTLAIVAVNVLLAVALRHFAGAGIGGVRRAFTAIFHVDTPARLAAAYGGLAILALVDVLAFARQALILAIFASLFAAIIQNRTLAAFFLELQNMLLGRFSRRPIGIGMFDFTPILFFLAVNVVYATSVAFTTILLSRAGILAAGAVAAQPY
jgi:uncharacterized protein YggT (Ycf19 family)